MNDDDQQQARVHNARSRDLLTIPYVRGELGPLTRSLDIDADEHQLFLILPCEAAQTYSEQVGGYSCQHRSERGLLLPLHEDPHSNARAWTDAAFDWFFRGNHAGWCNGGINEADVDWLNASFKYPVAPNVVRHMEVDRNRMADCCEAWIHVAVCLKTKQLTAPDQPPREGLIGTLAILTWLNSD